MPENTHEILNILCREDFISKFVLIGGTALAMQIRHRLSEDLDFIYDGDTLNINLIRRNISRIFPDYRITRMDTNEQIDLVINNVKITFFCSGILALPFKVIDHSFKWNKLRICTAEIIAVLKMSAIAQRSTMRDYYDLYWLTRYHLSLEKIIRRTKELIPALSPVTYSETLVYTNDIEETDISAHLQPQEKINKNQIADFFITELKKIIEKI
jgi:predicted nucleotidyltransferase component of viral defense system